MRKLNKALKSAMLRADRTHLIDFETEDERNRIASPVA